VTQEKAGDASFPSCFLHEGFEITPIWLRSDRGEEGVWQTLGTGLRRLKRQFH
jgi:hypothetical protein